MSCDLESTPCVPWKWTASLLDSAEWNSLLLPPTLLSWTLPGIERLKHEDSALLLYSVEI